MVSPEMCGHRQVMRRKSTASVQMVLMYDQLLTIDIANKWSNKSHNFFYKS